MRTELSARIAQMQQKLNSMQPVAQVQTDTQLFVSPDAVCQKLITLADIRPGNYVLEPSAGTGAILRAVLAAEPSSSCQAIEMNAALAEYLKSTFPEVSVTCKDFLRYTPPSDFDRIIMNPPFRHGDDVKHIRHALNMLVPGGNLVAVCSNGPRQRRAVKDIATHMEELPGGTFAVPTFQP